MLGGQVIDARPSRLRVYCQGGDPFGLTVRLEADGAPADVADWTWQAQTVVAGVVVPMATTGLPDGATLAVDADTTAAVAATGRQAGFELVGTDADGAALTVVAGWIWADVRLGELPPLELAVAV